MRCYDSTQNSCFGLAVSNYSTMLLRPPKRDLKYDIDTSTCLPSFENIWFVSFACHSAADCRWRVRMKGALHADSKHGASSTSWRRNGERGGTIETWNETEALMLIGLEKLSIFWLFEEVQGVFSGDDSKCKMKLRQYCLDKNNSLTLKKAGKH